MRSQELLLINGKHMPRSGLLVPSASKMWSHHSVVDEECSFSTFKHGTDQAPWNSKDPG